MNPFYKYRGVNHHSLLAARKFLREHHYDTSSDNTRASLYVHVSVIDAFLSLKSHVYFKKFNLSVSKDTSFLFLCNENSSYE